MVNPDLGICLWFDDQAEEAALFYTSIFEDAEIGSIAHYGKEGFEFHQKPEGAVMTVAFRIRGMHFLALNGGPRFRFSEAFSVTLHCEGQAEIDYYWSRLSEGGEEGPCGWLKDRFGLSWQITPKNMGMYMSHPDPQIRSQLMQAMFQMKKFDLAVFDQIQRGESD